jgi:translation initiation factor 4G
MQFMSVCKDRPDNLPRLDAIGLEPSEQPPYMSRGPGRRSMSGPAPPVSSRSQIGLGINTGAGFVAPKIGSMNDFNFGKFQTTQKMTNEERYAMANRVASSSGVPSAMPFRPAPMVRSTSQGGPGASVGSSTGRTRSKRGEKRESKAGPSTHPQGYGPPMATGPQGSGPMEHITPLTQSANAWAPASVKRQQILEPDSPEVVDRKVKGLLNKLTMDRFDSISDQIIAWANKSEREKDGRTLIQVIRLVFEKATDEAPWSEMYARLCRKMMEQISPKVQDEGIKNTEGKPITGGQLFRKYLLNRCQEDFERGWVAKETTAAAAASKALEDQAVKAAHGKAGAGDAEEEVALYSEEYYAAQKAKRQGLGLIKFIGELFKLQMLTERIMHECIKKLLGNVDNPEEEEIESLCKLITTVGSLLDTQKAHAHMDVYFQRMKDLTKSPNVSARMQFMLQVCINCGC